MASGNLFGNPISSDFGGVSDFYTKDQINSFLATKANTNTIYTRTYLDAEFLSVQGQINSLQTSKASLAQLNSGLNTLEGEILTTVSGLYALKTNVYTKSEVNSLLESLELDPDNFIRTEPFNSAQNTIYPGVNNATPLTLRGSSSNAFVQRWLSDNTDLIGYISNSGSLYFEREFTLGRLVSEGGIALDLQNKRLSNLAEPQIGPDAVNLDYLEEYVSDYFKNCSEANLAQEALLAQEAVKLQTPRSINGVAFDGTQNISISAPPSHSVYKTVYVSPAGNDLSTGRNENRPVASIERALEIIENQGDNKGWTVKLLGPVSTQGEIPVPDFTTIKSHNMQRRAIISPTSGSEERNVFLCGNGVHLYGLKFTGWRIDDFDNPTKGFAMAFRPGAIILPGGVPYGQNCVVTSSFTEVPTPLPMDAENGNPDQPRGGGCVLADASVLSGYTVYPNIMTWGFTPSSANGMGYVARNRGFINPVNAIGVGAHKHFVCLDGGQMVVSGSSSQFGDYSFWSEGSVQQTIPLKIDPEVLTSQDVSAVISSQKTSIIDNVWAYLVANYNAGSWPSSFEFYTRKDTGLLLDALSASLVHGFERPMLNFAEGLFLYDGECVYTYSFHNAFKASWDRVATVLIATDELTESSEDMVLALIDRLKDTMDNFWYEVGQGPAPTPVETVRRKLRSLITAINHQWTAPLAGVEFYRVPPARAARRIKRSIVQKNGGRVRFSGQDDAGNAVFVGGLVIDARSGQLGGPPFDSAIRGRVTRAVISRSY